MRKLKYIMAVLALVCAGAAKAEETEMKTSRTDLATAKYRELFRAERSPSPTDPEFMNILQDFIFGEVFYIGKLDDKTRELVTVTTLASLQTLPQLKAHLSAALNVGVTPLELREAIYQCAPYIGFPRTLNAIAVFNEVMKERGIALPLEDAAVVSDDTRYTEGAKIQNELYGAEVKEAMKSLPPEFREAVPDILTTFAFGDFYTRKGLDIKTREMLALVTLTAVGSEKQLSAHVLGSQKAGNSKEELLAVMVQMIPYVGMPNALTTINLIKNTDFSNYQPIYEDK